MTTPRISVIVPTFNRPDRITTLVDRLAAQTLEPADFEVIVVDDGSPVPVALDEAKHAFALRTLRQENAGPAAARNLGIAHARGDLVLFLNDDAIPADDLLSIHLAAHSATAQPTAVMGAFPFTDRSLREPFTRLLTGSDLLFDFPRLRHGELHGWTFFWTCNISLPTRTIAEVGGFDADTFHDAIVEDVELGYRLQKSGVFTLYRADAVCEHEHALTVDDYFRRALRLGVNVARMWRKHRDPTVLWQDPRFPIGPNHIRSWVAHCEAWFWRAQEFVRDMRRWSEACADWAVPAAEAAELRQLVRRFSLVPTFRGIVLELTGVDPGYAIAAGPAPGKLTSIIACSYNALEKTRNCLESIRRSADPSLPTEIVFVDNGSTDGSAEYLEAQSDVRLIRNPDNVGAPRGRNQALAVARGEYVVFIDNDVVVTPGWLARLRYHAEVDPLAACVGACADRASHGQQIEYEGPTDPESLERFATSVAEGNRRNSRPVRTLASFCMLVKRATIDELGGFDERFSPWGFEDDDYTLRAYFAGRYSRVALDVFVHHDAYTGPKLDRHTRLLHRNWGVFTGKWQLGDVPYGDFSKIEEARARGWSASELFVPFSSAAPPPVRPATP